MFQPRKTTWAQIEYNDIAGLRVGIGREGGLSGPLMNAVAQNDAFLHVVRAFEDEDVPHPIGSVDPARDLAAMDFELLFSDLMIVERSLERLEERLSKKKAYLERPADEGDARAAPAPEGRPGAGGPGPRPGPGARGADRHPRLPVPDRQAGAGRAQRGRARQRPPRGLPDLRPPPQPGHLPARRAGDGDRPARARRGPALLRRVWHRRARACTA